MSNATAAAAPNLSAREIAAREAAKLVADSRDDELAYLDVQIIKARARGFLEVASAYECLGEALRNGQLSLDRYLCSSAWQSVFGARAIN